VGLGDDFPQLALADAVPAHHETHHLIGKNLRQIGLGSGFAPALSASKAASRPDRHGTPIFVGSSK
jgi:hypothetical protein